MKRLAIIIPFYADDRAQAMLMARFVCALEERYRSDTILCFVNRWDADPLYPHEMMRFITTFPVEFFSSTTKASGHPAGPNAMAKDIFHEALRRSNVGAPWEDVDTILFMEPDCVPVAKDWIDQLRREWETQVDKKELVCGCYRYEGVDVPHVNGNALWTPRLAAHINVDLDCCGLGWDSAWAGQIGMRLFNTPLIENLFKETNVPESRMRENPFFPENISPVLIHGVKDRSAIEYAEKMTGVKWPT